MSITSIAESLNRQFDEVERLTKELAEIQRHNSELIKAHFAITATLSRAQEQSFRAGFTAGRGSDYDIDRHFQKWLLEAMR
jgi:phage regulator Rha-like protein